MPLQSGDIKIVHHRQTWILDSLGNRVQGYEITFTVRGGGNYIMTFPIDGFSPQLADQAIRDKATAIVDTLDLFK